MKAYITQYNFEKIFRDKFHFDESKKIDGTIHFMERIIDYYSDSEIQRLLAYQAFVKDPVAFLGQFRIPFRDTYTFVWENPPAYHSRLSCDFLHSDFSGKGAVIPEEIRKLGMTKIIEYRRFYKDNRRIHDSNPERFFDLVNAQFQTNLMKESEIIDIGHAPNSGVKHLENIPLEKIVAVFNKNIEIMLRYWEKHQVVCSNFAKRSYYITDYVRKNGSTVFYSDTSNMSNTRGKLFNGTGISDSDIIIRIKEIQQMKTLMGNLVKDIIFKEQYPEMSMDTTILEALGFKKCGKCYSNVVRTLGSNLIK